MRAPDENNAQDRFSYHGGKFMQKLGGLKSPTEFFEFATKHTQQQFERLTEQGKLLSALAQRVALETAEPIKSGLAKAQQKAA